MIPYMRSWHHCVTEQQLFVNVRSVRAVLSATRHCEEPQPTVHTRRRKEVVAVLEGRQRLWFRLPTLHEAIVLAFQQELERRHCVQRWV